MWRILKKTGVVAIVWLTAVSTLLASLPHIECRCPDGRVKVLCVTALVDPATDCRAELPTELAPCCCQKKPSKLADESRPVEEATHQTQIKPTGCTRQLVTPDPQVIAYTEVPTGQHLEVVQLGSPLPALTVVGPSRSAQPVWFSLPSPPDLIIALQHFLI
jgi:hypothetical protein